MKNDNDITQKAADVVARQGEDKLSDAVKLVNEEISKYEEKLRKILKIEENDPIMIEGRTMTGYECQMMVDPRDVVRIILHFDYPIYYILGQEAPLEMWEELGHKFGIVSVSSFNLGK